jgi:hypothetical protein
MNIFSVDWLGVIVGAVIAFVVGWAWYSPMLFGKQWAAGNNVALGTAQSMPMGAMGSQGLGLLLVSWAVQLVKGNWPGIILVAIAFAVLQASSGMFAKRSTTVIWVDFGYLVVSVIVMGIVQAII